MTAVTEHAAGLPRLVRPDWRLGLPVGWLVLVFTAAVAVDWLPVPTPTDMDFMVVESMKMH